MSAKLCRCGDHHNEDGLYCRVCIAEGSVGPSTDIDHESAYLQHSMRAAQWAPTAEPASSNLNKYLEWEYAGGPNECKHGYAAGIRCPGCDREKEIAAPPADASVRRFKTILTVDGTMRGVVGMKEHPDGDVVWYSDHEAALAASQATNKMLLDALQCAGHSFESSMKPRYTCSRKN